MFATQSLLALIDSGTQYDLVFQSTYVVFSPVFYGYINQ